ncbi:MAG: hypothetical protein WBB29_09100 [Geitlerinemataceae cyanobacterium]
MVPETKKSKPGTHANGSSNREPSAEKIGKSLNPPTMMKGLPKSGLANPPKVLFRQLKTPINCTITQ